MAPPKEEARGNLLFSLLVLRLDHPSLRTKEVERETDSVPKAVNLDFEARVPVPFSIFPSSYRDTDKKESVTTSTHEEVEIQLPHHHRPGREGSHVSSYSAAASADPRPRKEHRYSAEDEVFIVSEEREDDRYRRPGVRREEYYREELKEQQPRPARSSYTDTRIEVDTHRHHHHHHRPESVVTEKYYSPIDKIEREYRARYQPGYREDVRVTETVVEDRHHHGHHHHHRPSSYKETVHIDETVVDTPARRPVYKETVHVDETTVDTSARRPVFKETVHIDETTVDSPAHRPVRKETVHVDETTVPLPRVRPAHRDTVRVEETVKIDRSAHTGRHHHHHHHHHKANMGHFDEDGHRRSFRHGLHKLADRIVHPEGRKTREVVEIRESRPIRRGTTVTYTQGFTTTTVTIPSHHIRIGDILLLQGRPCQVIRISSSSATGQHRYLGVDLFTKQLHEESSQIHNPAPSVVVQTMKGPILKQYRVLDLQDGNVVAMTETGDVKQSLPVIDQSNLWERLSKAFDTGRGSVRVLVVNDHGREMAVDMKVLHGSSL